MMPPPITLYTRSGMAFPAAWESSIPTALKTAGCNMNKEREKKLSVRTSICTLICSLINPQRSFFIPWLPG